MGAKREKIDWLLLGLISLIVVLGFLMLFSVSAQQSLQATGNTYFFVKHQLIFGLIPGLILGLIAFKTPLGFLKKISPWLFLANLVLLVLVFIPDLGPLRGGARRWLAIGPFSFQPAEFLKITLPLYFCAWISAQKQKNLKTLFSFFLILVPLAIILLLQPDFSTLSMMVLAALLIYFLSETPWWHTFLIGMITAGIFLPLVVFKPYRMKRFLVFLDPAIDPMGMGYQIRQSLIAIGSGGFWGKGLGLSRQKFGLLPNVISDAIFAAFCEETGFLGPFILLSLFLFFLARTVMVAKKKKDSFSSVLIVVLAAEIVIQAFLNMGAMIGLIPLTGIPLSFISYGGTHLMVELTMAGLILNASKK